MYKQVHMYFSFLIFYVVLFLQSTVLTTFKYLINLAIIIHKKNNMLVL